MLQASAQTSSDLAADVAIVLCHLLAFQREAKSSHLSLRPLGSVVLRECARIARAVVALRVDNVPNLVKSRKEANVASGHCCKAYFTLALSAMSMSAGMSQLVAPCGAGAAKANYDAMLEHQVSKHLFVILHCQCTRSVATNPPPLIIITK